MKKSSLLSLLIFALYQYHRGKAFKKNENWKGFLHESKQFGNYQNLSIYNKLIFCIGYPVSYVRFLRLVAWDRIERVIV